MSNYAKYPRGRRPRPRAADQDQERLQRLYWRLLVLGVFAFLVVGTVFGLLFVMGAFDPVVTAENYERLKVGMREKELLKLLGDPHRVDESGRPAAAGPLRRTYPRRLFWESGEDRIWVDVTGGKVTQFGATLDGEQYGVDPDKNPPNLPGRQAAPDGD